MESQRPGWWSSELPSTMLIKTPSWASSGLIIGGGGVGALGSREWLKGWAGTVECGLS